MSKFTYDELINIPLHKVLKKKKEVITLEQYKATRESSSSLLLATIEITSLLIPFLISKFVIKLGWIVSIIIGLVVNTIARHSFPQFREDDIKAYEEWEIITKEIEEYNKQVDEENVPIIEYNKKIDEMKAELNSIKTKLDDIESIKKLYYEEYNVSGYFKSLDDILSMFAQNGLVAQKYIGTVIIFEEKINNLLYKDEKAIIVVGNEDIHRYRYGNQANQVKCLYKCDLLLKNTDDNIKCAENMTISDKILCIGFLKQNFYGYQNGGLYMDDVILLKKNSNPTICLLKKFFETEENEVNI